jgi:hypothetical protein
MGHSGPQSEGLENGGAEQLDYDDPEVEKAWATQERKTVRLYLASQAHETDLLPPAPAWSLAPYIALWEVETNRGAALWVISGDLPTDYLDRHGATTPREAVRTFALLWRSQAVNMLAGRADPRSRLGKPKDWPKLGDLLQRRAELLLDFAAHDGLWEE